MSKRSFSAKTGLTNTTIIDPIIFNRCAGEYGNPEDQPDEEGGDDQEHSHVGGDEPLEEELLEVVGHVAHNVDDQRRQKRREDDAQQPPLNRHLKETYLPETVLGWDLDEISNQFAVGGSFDFWTSLG